MYIQLLLLTGMAWLRVFTRQKFQFVTTLASQTGLDVALTEGFPLIGGYGRVYLQAPGMNATRQIDDVFIALCGQKAGNLRAAHAAMAHANDGFVCVELCQPSRNVSHGNVHSAGNLGYSEFLNFPNIQ
jgi:hypothetical protein